MCKFKIRRIHLLAILVINFCIFVLFKITKFDEQTNNYELRPTMDWLKKNRNLTYYLRPDENTFLTSVNQPKRCLITDGLSDEFIIYFVLSAPKNYKNRMAIRKTWGNVINPKPIFLLGISTDNLEMEKALNEAAQYQDVLIENFPDTYDTLTLKTMFALKSYLRLCPKAKYIMKIDDDVFVNPHIVNTVVANQIQPFIIGQKYDFAQPYRNPHHRWTIPTWLYEKDTFPPYVSGPSYILPGPLAEKIFSTALRLPAINLEDVFITGIVGHKTLGIGIIDSDKLKDYKPFTNNYCLYKDLGTAHKVSAEFMIYLWTELSQTKNIDKCYGILYTIENAMFAVYSILMKK